MQPFDFYYENHSNKPWLDLLKWQLEQKTKDLDE